MIHHDLLLAMQEEQEAERNPTTMAETSKEVKTYLVDYTCDQCGKGVMRNNGRAYPTHPMKYPHECTECGHKQTFLACYPTTKIEEL